MYWIAFNTSRKSTSIGRPAFDARGRKGSIRAHSSSVKSLGYRLVFFSIVAIRPRVAGVHIPSLNHGRKPHSTTFQTDSKVREFDKVMPSSAGALRRVRKKSGYDFPGVVVSEFMTVAGEKRVVVECTIPEVAGM